MRLLLFVALVSISMPVYGQTLGIYSNPSGTETCLNYGTEQEYYVVYLDGPPISSIQFSAPIPIDCGTNIFLGNESSYFFLGGSESTANVAFDACLAPPIHVMTIRMHNLTPPGWECCPWTPSNLQANDCSGNDVGLVYPMTGWLKNESCDLTPHSPTPPDGAAVPPSDVTLDWTANPRTDCELGDVRVYEFRFGTDPNNLSSWFDVNPPHTVTGLQSNTTYYWQVVGTTYNWSGPYPGPVWSFTTEGTVAAEKSTWGLIKALFQ